MILKVEIWTDIVCPFCYIGKSIFNEFLSELPPGESIEVINRSYELQPEASRTSSESTVLGLSRKYGITVGEAKEMMNGVTRMAKENHLMMNVMDALSANTYDLHRLIHLAKSKGKEEEMITAFYEAHFVHGVNLNDRSEQLRVSKEAGLSKEDVLEVLDSEEYSEEVRRDKMKAKKLSITGVPYFLFNDSTYISGAQPKAAFHQLYDQMKKEDEKKSKDLIE